MTLVFNKLLEAPVHHPLASFYGVLTLTTFWLWWRWFSTSRRPWLASVAAETATLTFILGSLLGASVKASFLVAPALAFGGVRIRQGRASAASRPIALTAAVALLWGLAWLPLVTLLLWPLWGPYPELSAIPSDARAIVVLGGGTGRESTNDPPTLGRVARAAALWRLRPDLTIIPSGGGSLSGRTESEAEYMRRLLIGHGVPAQCILVEPHARTTAENARETARLIEPRGWTRIILVSDAEHLPRGAACFRHQGFRVSPAPTVARRFAFAQSDLWPSFESLERARAGIHEYAGIVWYWVTGRI